MISMIPQSYFDKFGALRRLLGTFFKNVGDFLKNVGPFPKNVGLFLRNLPRFFFYLPRFFSPKIAMQQPPCVKVVKAKSAKSLLMCARNTRTREGWWGRGVDYLQVVSYDCYERIIRYFLKS